MDQPIIYHNSSCSKCMLATHILEQRGFEPIVINYLERPLNRQEICDLLMLLNINAEQLVRKEEPLFIEYYSNSEMDENNYIDALVKFPALMQRPVVVYKGKAIIARPSQKVEELF